MKIKANKKYICNSNLKNKITKFFCLFLCCSLLFNFFSGYVLAITNKLRDSIYIDDPSTMNSYQSALINDVNGSRYAGRIWSDKSVFLGNISLVDETSGYDGTIINNSDFLHVFSILGSSIQQNTYSSVPIDLVIALDMSASMAQDVRYPINSLYDSTDGTYADSANRTMEKRIANSRIQKTLDGVNQTIDDLMELNENNRVSVVVFGAGAEVIMPLAHYKKVNDSTPYLKVGGMETLYTLDDLVYDDIYGWLWTRNMDACYTIEAEALKDDNDNPTFSDSVYKKVVSNNVKNTKVKARPGYEQQTKLSLQRRVTNINENLNELSADTYVGYFTNAQGGLYLAYSQLALEENTTFEIELPNKQKEIFARMPAAVVLSDGSTNFAFNKMDNWNLHYGDYGEVYHSEWNQSWPYFREDNSPVNGLDNTDLSHRINQNKGDEWYNVYIPGVDDNFEITSLYNPGMIRENGTLTYVPSCYNAGILYSSHDDLLATSGTVLEYLMTASYMKNVVVKHYENGWNEKGALESTRIPFSNYTMIVNAEGLSQYEKFRLYPTMDPAHHPLVTDANWWDNEEEFGPELTLYGDLVKKSTIFNGMIKSWNDWVSGSVATANMSGADVKINIKPIPPEEEYNAKFDVTVTNKDVIDNIVYNDEFFDITSDDISNIFERIIFKTNSSAFTPISGTNDDGVADSLTYSDPIGKYMEIKDKAMMIGNKTFDMSLLLFGEMYGIEKAGIYDYSFNKNHRGNDHKSNNLDEKFTMGWYDRNGNYLENGGSWDNGDTYYLDVDTIKKYVPTIDESSNLDEQQRNKTYVVYGFAESYDEQIKERENISYGDNGNITFKLSDIRVWIERDSSKEEYNNLLYVNIPATAIPLQVVSVQLSSTDEIESYKTNLSNKKASTPLRLFYGVGLDDEVLTVNNGIDLNKISIKYIENNTKDGYLNFYSNYYSNTIYDGYTADTLDGARTRGDSVTTFSPSEGNRYYVYQKNLKLYKYAYVIGENGEVTLEDSPKLFAGSDFDGEFVGKTENGEINKTAYDAIQEAFKEGKLRTGDIITLKDDVVKYGESPSSDDYYYFIIDYFVPTEDGKGALENYVVSRKGSEFGSGILQDAGDKIAEGDFLSWIDITGTSSNVYNYNDIIPEAERVNGDWVLVTKIGGLRIGDLHQNIQLKSENRTATSRSYFLPVIVDDLSNEGYDAILNTYLGNNGLIKYEIVKYLLPESGGIGTIIFIISGICLLGLAVYMIYRKKI